MSDRVLHDPASGQDLQQFCAQTLKTKVRRCARRRGGGAGAKAPPVGRGGGQGLQQLFAQVVAKFGAARAGAWSSAPV